MAEFIDIRPEDWSRMQQQVSWLRAGLIATLLLLAALAFTFFQQRSDKIIRTQSIVIVDAHGHDRMLIGAPVPASTDRARRDDHSDGIIFLSSTGADRLALGQMPAPVIGGKSGKRIGDGDNYRIALYDKKGNERGGMAFLGMGRVGIALDRAAPLSDAIGLMVDDRMALPA